METTPTEETRCQSPNHPPGRETIEPWSCMACGRVCCYDCEGADDEEFDLCDDCWAQKHIPEL